MPPKDQPPVEPVANETATAIQAMADALIARQPVDPNNMGLSDAKRRALTEPPTAQRYRILRLQSEETGATFDAVVVESANKAAFPHGRITKIENYRFPEAGMFAFQSAGGRVPDGHPIFNHGHSAPPSGGHVPKEALDQFYLTWRLETFTHPDFRRYVGKAMKAHLAVDGEKAIQSPWLTSGNMNDVVTAAE